MFKGIDVSHNNGLIDWSGVKDAGIDFAMIRAGYGSAASQVDKQFHYNTKNALAVGIECGAYWFSYATNRAEAIAEARFFLVTVRPYRFTYPLAFDYEYDSVDYAKKRGIVITPGLACDIADGFMSTVAAAGYYIVNYTNVDFITRYFAAPCMGKYEVWLARWTANKPDCVTGIWQNEVRGSLADRKKGCASAIGGLSGVTGAIDMDISYKDYPAIIREKRLNHLATVTAPAPVVKPVETAVTMKKGDKTRVLNTVTTGGGKRGKTYTGGTFRVYRDTYDVISVSGARVVIGVGAAVTAAVNAKDIQKV